MPGMAVDELRLRRVLEGVAQESNARHLSP